MRKALYILGQLSDEDLDWMLQAGQATRVPVGQRLIEEGQPIAALWIVLEGNLAVTTKAVPGQTVAHLGAGEVIGEISFVDSRPPSATVTAAEDTLVFRLDRAALADHLAQDAHFAQRFYRALALFLASRLRQTTSRLGYTGQQALDENAEYAEELEGDALDNLHLAGARFEHLLKHLRAQI